MSLERLGGVGGQVCVCGGGLRTDTTAVPSRFPRLARTGRLFVTLVTALGAEAYLPVVCALVLARAAEVRWRDMRAHTYAVAERPFTVAADARGERAMRTQRGRRTSGSADDDDEGAVEFCKTLLSQFPATTVLSVRLVFKCWLWWPDGGSGGGGGRRETRTTMTVRVGRENAHQVRACVATALWSCLRWHD